MKELNLIKYHSLCHHLYPPFLTPINILHKSIKTKIFQFAFKFELVIQIQIQLNQMCKHILNVQAAIRAKCCDKWFDCSDCHNEVSEHPLKKTNDMIFACKKCSKVFRKDMLRFEEADQYCPYCDNKYILDAVTKEDR